MTPRGQRVNLSPIGSSDAKREIKNKTNLMTGLPVINKVTSTSCGYSFIHLFNLLKHSTKKKKGIQRKTTSPSGEPKNTQKPKKVRWTPATRCDQHTDSALWLQNCIMYIIFNIVFLQGEKFFHPWGMKATTVGLLEHWLMYY